MAASKRKKNKIHFKARIVLCLVLVAVLCVSLIWQNQINVMLGLAPAKTEASESDGELGGDLNVHFVDVGQGDALIIELPGGERMIIDGGKDSEKSKLLEYIENTVFDTTDDEPDYFDYAILTHPDEDHCGGLDDVLALYPAKVFYRPAVLATRQNYVDPGEADVKAKSAYGEHGTLAYSRTITEGYNADNSLGITTEVRISDAEDDDISVITPQGVATDDPNYYTVTFYSPLSGDYSDINDYSPIIILEYHGRRIALSGDAEKRAEEEFVAEAKKGAGKYAIFTEQFTVDVIKLGHHGSRTSSQQEYLETLTTTSSTADVLAVISCGVGNSYGHPHPETLARLSQMGFKDENILSTAVEGTIALSVRGSIGDDGQAQYVLYRGANAYRAPQASKLQWRTIVLIACGVIVLILIVEPLVRTAVRAYKSSGGKTTSKSTTRKRK